MPKGVSRGELRGARSVLERRATSIAVRLAANEARGSFLYECALRLTSIFASS